MTNTTITKARENLFKYAESCIKYNDVININTKNGNVIMLNEEEYRGLLETMEIYSRPHVKDSIEKGLKTPLAQCEEIKWRTD